jgi:hypothetical protein
MTYLHNEGLLNLDSSPNIIKVNMSRNVKWARHVARMARRGMHVGFGWQSHKEREQ